MWFFVALSSVHYSRGCLHQEKCRQHNTSFCSGRLKLFFFLKKRSNIYFMVIRITGDRSHLANGKCSLSAVRLLVITSSFCHANNPLVFNFCWRFQTTDYIQSHAQKRTTPCVARLISRNPTTVQNEQIAYAQPRNRIKMVSSRCHHRCY